MAQRQEAILKILVADDHQMVREGVKGVLAELDTDLIVLEAEDFSGVIESISAHTDLDLVLLDISMPGMDGVKNIIQLKSLAPDIPVAILSAHNDPKLVKEALAIGADGYISKTSKTAVMLHAIRLILDGEIYIPSLFLEPNGLDITEQEQPSSPLDNLTPRQLEVFDRMRTGASNKEIAREIGCAESTVKAHVTAILKTLNVNSRAKACALELN
ncbi:response regulator [Kiloniella sp.]|uniref:response regulator transcription factor n=1 Tax=Kiloniella sp. TaxID=1938587 RepID=UPI003B01A5B4